MSIATLDPLKWMVLRSTPLNIMGACDRANSYLHPKGEQGAKGARDYALKIGSLQYDSNMK